MNQYHCKGGKHKLYMHLAALWNWWSHAEVTFTLKWFALKGEEDDVLHLGNIMSERGKTAALHSTLFGPLANCT